ncbi:hypothetical protein YC2023_112481 [Brassica napus]|uniref:(rape) hypothetical protein n=1 Tax=Brassica napus TaxID=3708 RepID=A0A816PS97_BRANA|nr:unnamed protein product [Brassica napus]
MATDCTKFQIGINVYALSDKYTDIASLGRECMDITFSFYFKGLEKMGSLVVASCVLV